MPKYIIAEGFSMSLSQADKKRTEAVRKMIRKKMIMSMDGILSTETIRGLPVETEYNGKVKEDHHG